MLGHFVCALAPTTAQRLSLVSHATPAHGWPRQRFFLSCTHLCGGEQVCVCVPVGADHETLCAVLPQVQHDGGLLELFLEFIAVPVLG